MKNSLFNCEKRLFWFVGAKHLIKMFTSPPEPVSCCRRLWLVKVPNRLLSVVCTQAYLGAKCSIIVNKCKVLSLETAVCCSWRSRRRNSSSSKPLGPSKVGDHPAPGPGDPGGRAEIRPSHRGTLFLSSWSDCHTFTAGLQLRKNLLINLSWICCGIYCLRRYWDEP